MTLFACAPVDVFSQPDSDFFKPAQSITTQNATEQSDTKKHTKSQPKIITFNKHRPIQTIPLTTIKPFFVKTKILPLNIESKVSTADTNNSPYLLRASDYEFRSTSNNNILYAKGNNFPSKYYGIYKKAHQIIHPITKDTLGTEAIYVGEAKLLSAPNNNGIATLKLTKQTDKIQAGDIFMPLQNEQLPKHFSPKLATFEQPTVIIGTVGQVNTSTNSQFSTILISAGQNNGLKLGDSFYIFKAKATTTVDKNGKLYTLPSKPVGIGIIYQTFAKTSFALITDAYDIIHSGDRLIGQTK